MKTNQFWYAIGKCSPVRIIVISFLLLIVAGTALLSLPFAYRDEPIGILNTAFTATSATCVTGLIVRDTAQHWTVFGQTVLLVLIQVGGLGFMAVVSLFAFVGRRSITLKERVVMSEAFSGLAVGGIVRMMRRILIGTFLFEGIGACLLATVFIPDFGILPGIWKSIFISVSAFCNAGFDVLGDAYGAFAGLTPYRDNLLVNMTICILVIMGGLGFFVWGRPRGKRMPLHSRLVLSVTATLVLGGTALFYVLEYKNPLTLEHLSQGEKLLAAFFQSVTTRTAGFNTISNADLSVPSKLLTMLLMFIGGSPGSTAGGVKTVTFTVALWSAFSALRGKSDVNMFRRRIPRGLVLRALSVTAVASCIAIVSAFLLICAGGGSNIDLAFEAFSALGTVGLGTGITPALPQISKILLILLMFTGRVGIMSLAVAVLLKEEKSNAVRFAEEKIMLG